MLYLLRTAFVAQNYKYNLKGGRMKDDFDFSAEQLAQDFVEFHDLVEKHWGGVDPAGWNHPPHTSNEWTGQQTLAHLLYVAEQWQDAMTNALSGLPSQFSPTLSRQDLPQFNEQGLATYKSRPAAQLLKDFLILLKTVSEQTKRLSDEALVLSIPMPFYNRPLSLAELLGCHLAHAGLVHAGQIAQATRTKPLWTDYTPALTQQIITYFMYQFSHAYWPERGGNLEATINFRIFGAGGGQWWLRVGQDGGDAGSGRVKKPTLTILMRHPHTFFQLITLQISPIGAILRGQVLAWGYLPLALKLPYLFNPT